MVARTGVVAWQRCCYCCCLFAALCAAAVYGVDANIDHEFDVIIVGGGIAGVSAVLSLMSSNVTNFLLIEARDALGGRVRSESFGAGIHEGRVEVGANWIHGVSLSGDTNPIHRLAEGLGLKKAHIPGSCANLSGYELFHENGMRVEHQKERVERFDAAVNCANASAANGGPDRSFTVALESCGWFIRDAVDSTMEWEGGSANDILEPSLQSLDWMFPDPTYSELGPDDFFVFDQRPRGYGSVVYELLKEAGLEEHDERLLLKSVVEDISLSETSGAKVTLKDGRSFKSKFVISTLPLGVMQWSHQEIFRTPPLPSHQVRALQAFTMGNFTKIWAMWPERFWSERGMQWIAADDRDMPFGMPKEFHDIGGMVPGFEVLFTYIVGENAAKWEAMTDEVAAVLLVERLRRLFPEKDVPYPTAFKMTRHGSDPLMRGAYSTAKVNVPFEAMEAMAKPLQDSSKKDRIFFGGEHTCTEFQGYLHGGYESGIMAAEGVVKEMGVKAKYHTRCNDRTKTGLFKPDEIVV